MIFKPGDLVAHRASGQRGVVIRRQEECINGMHQLGYALIHAAGFNSECAVRDSYLYDISLGYTEAANGVHSSLLRLVSRK